MASVGNKDMLLRVLS